MANNTTIIPVVQNTTLALAPVVFEEQFAMGPRLNYSASDINSSVVNNGPNLFIEFGMPTLESGDSIKNSINSAITALSVALLFEVMLGMGCSVDLVILKQHLKKPVGVIAASITQFGFMPAIAFGLAKGLNLSAVPAMAILLTASVPGGSLSNILTYLAKGDVSLSILMSTVSTLLSLGFIPLNLILYGTAYLPPGRNAASIVPFSAIVLSFFIMLFPMTCGMILKQKKPSITGKVINICKISLLITITALVILSCFLYGVTLLVIMPRELWLVPALMPAIGFAIGFILATIGGLTGDARRTVAIETGCQNCQMSVAVLKVAFPSDVIGPYFLFPFIYAIFQFGEGFLMILATRFYLDRYGNDEKEDEYTRTFSAQKFYNTLKTNLWRKSSIKEDKATIIDKLELEEAKENEISSSEDKQQPTEPTINETVQKDDLVSTKETWVS